MPELPEVETTLRGVRPFIKEQGIQHVLIRSPRLRWPIPKESLQQLSGQTFHTLQRRGKYLLFTTQTGTLIIHLGMSGRLAILKTPLVACRHDHMDILFKNDLILRFTDPRRFGALLWTDSDPFCHPLLIKLGIEPLSRHFNTSYLEEKLARKKLAIKAALMDQHIVVGVGNIYITEALFMARIHPLTPAHEVSLSSLAQLVSAIKQILRRAIAQGGTTLKDFFNTQGKPGYFKQSLQVYGRAGQPCRQCQNPLSAFSLCQRTTVYCPVCQEKYK
jgi:formamidopyrimidine-DNA glycosylase